MPEKEPNGPSIEEHTPRKINFPPSASIVDARYLGLTTDRGPFFLNEMGGGLVI